VDTHAALDLQNVLDQVYTCMAVIGLLDSQFRIEYKLYTTHSLLESYMGLVHILRQSRNN
jgi:hypothetical protein